MIKQLIILITQLIIFNITSSRQLQYQAFINFIVCTYLFLLLSFKLTFVQFLFSLMFIEKYFESKSLHVKLIKI